MTFEELQTLLRGYGLKKQLYVDENDCWRCPTNMATGYVQFSGPWGARLHRLSYTLAKGEIPTGLVIDHTCGVRDCQNPKHLEAVTQAENIRRAHHDWKGVAKVRYPHCRTCNCYGAKEPLQSRRDMFDHLPEGSY